MARKKNLVTGETIRGIGTGIKGLITGKSAFQQEKERREREFQRLLVPEGTTITQTTEGEVFTRGGGRITETETPALSIDVTSQADQAIKEDRPGGLFVRKGTNIPSGLELPSKAGETPRVFLGLNKADIASILKGQGLDPQALPLISDVSVNEQQILDFLNAVRKVEEGLPLTALEQELIEQEGKVQAPTEEGRVERFSERGAEVGLQFEGLKTENLVGTLFEITGLTKGQQIKANAAELSETQAGKILGLSNVGILTAGLLTGLFFIVPLVVGGVLAKLATVSGGGGVLGGLGIAGLVGGGGDLLGIDKDVIVDRILDREDAQEIQGAITTSGQLANDIVATVRAGGISKAQGIAEINKEETDVNILESRVHQAVKLDPRVAQSGQYIDIMKDIQDSRSQFRTAKADILALDPEFNPNELIILLKRFQDIEAGKTEAFQPTTIESP